MVTPKFVESAFAWTLIAAGAMTGSVMVAVGLFVDLAGLLRRGRGGSPSRHNDVAGRRGGMPGTRVIPVTGARH